MAAADTLVTVVVLGAVGGVAAYVTNFMGFKAWADTHLIQQPPPPPPPPPTNGNGNEPPIKNDPSPKPGNTFKCVSYPRCNTVSGTDARKRCCCNNKCSLLGRALVNGRYYKSINYSTNECFCNPKTVAPPPKPTCSCPFGKVNPILTGRACTEACCRLYGSARCSTKKAVINSKNQCVCTTTATVVHNSNCTSVENSTCWKSSGCYNGKTGIYATCISGRGRCTDARAAFMKKYGCPVYLAQAYAYPADTVYQHGNFPQNEVLDEGLMQVPTLA